MNWYNIEPKDALNIDCRTRPDLNPPVSLPILWRYGYG